MQSLVYDFGQLSSTTEQQYTKKIVERYVCHVCVLTMASCVLNNLQKTKIQSLDVTKVAKVLMACQNYMRERTVVVVFVLY